MYYNGSDSHCDSNISDKKLPRNTNHVCKGVCVIYMCDAYIIHVTYKTKMFSCVYRGAMNAGDTSLDTNAVSELSRLRLHVNMSAPNTDSLYLLCIASDSSITT